MMLGMALEIQGVIATFVIMLLIWSIVFSWDAFYPYVAEVFLNDIPNLISEMTGTDANSTLKTFVKIVFDVISTSMASVDTGITNVVSGLFFVLMYLCLCIK
jgi:type IV secretion system protein VirB6